MQSRTAGPSLVFAFAATCRSGCSQSGYRDVIDPAGLQHLSSLTCKYTMHTFIIFNCLHTKHVTQMKPQLFLLKQLLASCRHLLENSVKHRIYWNSDSRTSENESTNMIKCNKNVCTDVPASLWCLRLSFRLTVTAQFTVYSQGEKTKLSQISLEEKLEAKRKNRILVLTLQLRRVFSRDLKTVGEAEVLIQRARTSRVCSCESSDCQSGQREQRRQ